MRSLTEVLCSCGVLSTRHGGFLLKTISVVYRHLFLSCPQLKFYAKAIAATFTG